MGRKLEKSRQAVAQFFKTANPEDEFFLVQFNDRADLIQPFTSNLEEIQNRLTFTQSKGRTALLDAVYLALNEMKKAKNPRKALLIISDGGDNSSRYTEGEIKNLVKEADVQIYAHRNLRTDRRRAAGRRKRLPGQGLLTEIAEQTGGRQYPVDNLNELPDIAAKIGVELRNQYVLGYSPQNQERDGKYRKVQVKLVQPRGLPPLRPFWKHGLLCAVSIRNLVASPQLLAGWRVRRSWRSNRRRSAHNPAGRHRNDLPRPTPAWWCCTPPWSDKSGHLVTDLPQRGLHGVRERRQRSRSRSSSAKTFRCRWG